jgi:hypothetical protein
MDSRAKRLRRAACSLRTSRSWPVAHAPVRLAHGWARLGWLGRCDQCRSPFEYLEIAECLLLWPVAELAGRRGIYRAFFAIRLVIDCAELGVLSAAASLRA